MKNLITIPFLDFNVPNNQYLAEAKSINSPIAFFNIAPELACSQDQDFIVITDQALHLFDYVKSNNKIIWLLEPVSIHPHAYELTKKLSDKARYVFSHDKQFVQQIPNAKYCPWGSYFIKPEHHQLYKKTKNKTMIASSKNYTIGHKLRHEILNALESKIDNVRRGGTAHKQYQNEGDEYKLNFLKDYRFSIEVENAPISGYFTEKILDCFRTATIPIYFGDPEISNYFDNNGILTFSNIEELSKILDLATEEMYLSKIQSVVDNYNRAEKYLYPWKFIGEFILNELSQPIWTR